MGYDMYTVRQPSIGNGNGDGYFRANIWGMALLRGIMQECGVEPGEARERECKPDPETGNRRTLEGDLYSCFGSNDGWLVTPEECEYIAERLEAGGFGPDGAGYQHWDIKGGKTVRVYEKFTDDDRQFAREFADYCKRAAPLGGFYVW